MCTFLVKNKSMDRWSLFVDVIWLIELIEENRHRSNDSAYSDCTITGTPGIGKTFFALFLFFTSETNILVPQ